MNPMCSVLGMPKSKCGTAAHLGLEENERQKGNGMIGWRSNGALHLHGAEAFHCAAAWENGPWKIPCSLGDEARLWVLLYADANSDRRKL